MFTKSLPVTCTYKVPTYYMYLQRSLPVTCTYKGPYLLHVLTNNNRFFLLNEAMMHHCVGPPFCLLVSYTHHKNRFVIVLFFAYFLFKIAYYSNYRFNLSHF